ncbi:MAG: twin-arginine translocation signal domain-containing protein [Betaproteobacteria bacterium]|nr:twin-arginine translocation signal domain-containing protein [Betaproteobacteria bacterium]
MSYEVLPAVSSSMTPTCACCAPVSLRSAQGLNRRGFLNLGAAGVAGAALASMVPGKSFAASGNYQAMLVNCIDPRFTTLSWQYMGLIQGVSRDKLEDNYSHFVMAGGPIGAVHPKFASWHATYWDNLDITVSLHHIKRVIGITHRDCGAAKLAFGPEAVSDKDKETDAHTESLALFRQQVNKRHPKLSVITGIMDTNGRVDLVG